MVIEVFILLAIFAVVVAGVVTEKDEQKKYVKKFFLNSLKVFGIGGLIIGVLTFLVSKI